MKQILQSKLEELEWLSKNAGNWEYYLGQYDLCLKILAEIDKLDQEEYEVYNTDNF